MAEDEVVIKPPEARFIAGQSGASKHKVENKTGQKMATKIKCSNNNAYRVRPVYAWLPELCGAFHRHQHRAAQANGTFTLEVTRQPYAAKDDRLVIQYLPASNQKQPKDVFLKAPSGTVVPDVRLLLFAAEKLDTKTAMLGPPPGAPRTAMLGPPPKGKSQMTPKTALPGPPPKIASKGKKDIKKKK